MSRILYYLVLIPLAHLPLRMLYVLADGLYVLIYRLLGYRTKVVRANLRTAFPQRSAAERRDIERRFYRHLMNVVVEAVREFRMPEREFVELVTCTNPDVLDELAKHSHAVLCAGHYGNWEVAAAALPLQTKYVMDIPYTPLSNRFMDRKIKESRGRTGMRLLPKEKTRTLTFDAPPPPARLLTLGTDQCPGRRQRPYFLDFLGVPDTPVQFGAEHFAKKYNLPVVYMDVAPQRRGHSEMTVHLITLHPRDTPHGWITEQHTRHLERQIARAPEYWLWTHKRWKRSRTDYPAVSASDKPMD